MSATSASPIFDDGEKMKVGLKIHLFSFSLPHDLIKDTDEVRVSITSMPERVKQYFYFHGKEINNTDHVFSLNITNKTEEIIVVFRRKDFIENDPIVASTIIHNTEFPKIPQNINDLSSDKKITPIKTVKILEPNHKQKKNPNKERKVIGKMKVQLSLTVPFLENEESNNNNSKTFLLMGKKEEVTIGPKYNNYMEYMLF